VSKAEPKKRHTLDSARNGRSFRERVTFEALTSNAGTPYAPTQRCRWGCCWAASGAGGGTRTDWHGGRGQCLTRLLGSHTGTHCDTLQHTATHCNTLQHATTHCNTLQHNGTHCDTLLHTATHCYTLLHTATHSDILYHTATHCNTHSPFSRHQFELTHYNTLQHAAIFWHCTRKIKGLQHMSTFGNKHVKRDLYAYEKRPIYNKRDLQKNHVEHESV